MLYIQEILIITSAIIQIIFMPISLSISRHSLNFYKFPVSVKLSEAHSGFPHTGQYHRHLIQSKKISIHVQYDIMYKKENLIKIDLIILI